MITISGKSIDLDGLTLYADRPPSPKTREFLAQHNMYVERSKGMVHLSGPALIAPELIEAFVHTKQAQGGQVEAVDDIEDLDKSKGCTRRCSR